MKKLTKLERFTAYCILLAEKKDLRCGGYEFGFCNLWNKITGGISHYCLPETLPELYAKAKSGYGPFWFGSTKERIAALKQCIIETHP